MFVYCWLICWLFLQFEVIQNERQLSFANDFAMLLSMLCVCVGLSEMDAAPRQYNTSK